MKHIYTLLIIFLPWVDLLSQGCAVFYQHDANQEAAFLQWLNDNRNLLEKRNTITISVVVHVVWRLPSQQISEAQVLSQIEVLNQDFRALNTDLSQVPEDFQDLIADLEIEFCLAQQDPDGQPTNGITYTQTSLLNAGTIQVGGLPAIFYTDLGGRDAWNPDHYLNIWVAERAFACGAGIFPNEASSEEDGVIIRQDCFGTTGTATPPYHLGRTTTHEIGHYFNLLHVWGTGIIDLACLEDDLVDDTPDQAFNYLDQCPMHPQVSCGSRDMFMNYMNLSDDACLNMFTPGQKERVWAAINMYRSGLMESIGCKSPMVDATENNPLSISLKIVGQPVRNTIHLILENSALLPLNLRLFNANGQLVYQGNWLNPGSLFINCSAWSDGIYFLVVDDREHYWSQKVILLR